MRENSLIYFENPSQMMDFIDSLEIYNGWRIESGLLNDRGKLIEDKQYTKMLRDSFAKKGFFRKRVSLAEIVSWLDNLILIRRLFLDLKKQIPLKVFESMKISVEYMIEMSKKMRVDYLISYNNKVLILELRTVNSFSRIRSTWEMKFSELKVYKELMSYYMCDKNFYLFALIPMFEYDDNKKVPKNINYNNNQIKYLSEFIKKYLIL